MSEFKSIVDKVLGDLLKNCSDLPEARKLFSSFTEGSFKIDVWTPIEKEDEMLWSVKYWEDERFIIETEISTPKGIIFDYDILSVLQVKVDSLLETIKVGVIP